MKVLKALGISLVAILVLFFGVAAILPSTASLERSIVIERPQAEVFRLLDDYNEFHKWNPWAKYEPTARTTISTPATGVGATYEWEGERIGSGKLTRSVSDSQRIEEKLEFKAPMESVARSYFALEPEGQGTRLIWGYEGAMDYPMGRYFGLMLDGMLGKDYESGLAAFKVIAESAPSSPSP